MNIKRTLRVVESNKGALNTVLGSLLSAAGGEKPFSLLVTSARPGEGKTTCAISIARGLALSGKTLLMEGSLSAPQLNQVFRCEKGPGLKEFFNGDSIETCARETEYPNLMVLPMTSADGDFASSLDMETLAAKLESLKGVYDSVVIDGASITRSSEAALMAAKTDGVVFVAECEKTKWEVLDVGVDMVKQVGGKPLGVILNKRRYYVPKFFYGSV